MIRQTYDRIQSAVSAPRSLAGKMDGENHEYLHAKTLHVKSGILRHD
jgi:hypothetical protein